MTAYQRKGYHPFNKVTDLKIYFEQEGMDYALFAELVDNGISASAIKEWKVGKQRAFPRSWPTIRKFVKLYEEGKQS